jgi:regulator of protease activity HflC (stomatin/prohibitin superfamily)
MNWSAKKIIGAVGLFFLIIMVFMFAGKAFEDIDAGEIVVIQDPWDGELHVYKTSGMVWQGGGKATHYKKSNTYWFSAAKDKDDVDKSIPVKWNDGGHANISGSIRYDLPTDDKQIIALHSTFGSQEAIENTVIKTNIEKAIYLTGPLMTSKESYAERRNDLIFYIEDQASKGVYKTRQIEVKEIDPITGNEKNTTKVDIQIDTTTGVPKRQEASPVAANGIKLYNISINGISYDKNVENQIATQQQAIMQVQTAIANAKRAEQEALTTAKQGEANAAAAKWEQEVIKAKMVTEAEAANAVAVLAVKTAQLNKERLILEGEGEAAKKRLVMQANGALEQKLEAWLRSQQYWSDAFSKFQGNLVPLYQSGNQAGGTSNAMNWMEIMGIKAMRDLNLDMSNKN